MNQDLLDPPVIHGLHARAASSGFRKYRRRTRLGILMRDFLLLLPIPVALLPIGRAAFSRTRSSKPTP